MTRKDYLTRNAATASSSNEAWAKDTAEGIFGGGSRGTPIHIHTNEKKQFEKESQISPNSGAPLSTAYNFVSPSGSPLDQRSVGGFRNYRRDLSVLDTSGGSVPSISRNPPTATSVTGPRRQWGPYNNPTVMPSSALPGSFEESTENLPPFRPGTGRTAASDSPDMGYYGDGSDRRPSIASATTVSSTGSKSSVSKPISKSKKLQGFFGEDFAGRDSRRGSATSLQPYGTRRRDTSSHSQRDRNNSQSTTYACEGRTASPNGSRPRTPAPSSDVVPFLYQNFQDIPQYGDAPVRQEPAGPDKQRYAVDDHNNASTSSSLNLSNHSHKLHFPVHRHTRSKEDSARIGAKDINHMQSLRSGVSREDSPSSLRKLKDHVPSSMSSRTNLGQRPSSPSPSPNGGLHRDTSVNHRSPGGKRSLLDKLKLHRHKEDRDSTESLKNLPPSVRSLQEIPRKTAKIAKLEPSPKILKRDRDATLATFDSGATARPSDYVTADKSVSKKEHAVRPHLGHHGRMRTARRGLSYDKSGSKDLRDGRVDTSQNQSLFSLDTDLSHMEGIVSQPPIDPPDGGIFTGLPPGDEEPRNDLEEVNGGAGGWNAPDSWAVKKVGDENMGRLREIDDAGVPSKDQDDGTPHCVRVFRVDFTFATLSATINTTVSEILQLLGKKSFLQDDLENYQLLMRKHDLQRHLQAGERPIAIQKRLLEQAGYTESDRLDEIGREDNSYLCRFTFVPTKLSGYYSLERDPGFGKTQKFSHVDLQGRNLITIPITLYQKAAEIISLNLSRNLSLDIPKDFIQGCTNLREIRYISNEAWHLPPSLSLATRLTVLDISNNRLEQLEHAELDKLPSLLSIKLANNKLTQLPQYFGSFKALRSLNISSNYLEKFPDFLCDLKSLVDLDISFNTISGLPKIGQLTTLERLWATNNRLTGAFPDSFRNLVNLKEVDIRFNGISSIDVIAVLPKLEQLMVGHNSVSVFEGAFAKIRTLQLNHNPVTHFAIQNQVPTLTTLSLASAKLVQLRDDLFEKVPNLTKLILDKNHFVSLTSHIGRLRRLEHLSIAKNSLSSLPAEIGQLQELRFLDVRENNLKKLPSEIWCALRLDTLNVSSNVLESFPKPGASPSAAQSDTTPSLTSSPSFEELGKLENFGARRPSQASGGLLSVGSSPAGSTRKPSIVSVYGPGGRKASIVSRTNEGTNTPTTSRKDSTFSNRVATTFAGSLRHLFLADNRLDDDVFDELVFLTELRVLNLSYCELTDLPQRSIRRWPHLAELYLSGNELTSLPSDDLEEVSSLKVLHLNGNKFQVLPAELGKVHKLAILDVGSNALKYNVSNWPYDWNWNWNHNLKYLNLSGNKRLEIKPNLSYSGGSGGRDGRDLTDFSSLQNLRVLGLMDVTLTVPSVPDQTEDRRVRTSGSLAGAMAYGMADTIGRNEHLSTIDMVVPKFRSHDTETLLGMFDGQALSSGGSKVAKFLHENFSYHFTEELSRLRKGEENPGDALRRTFLALNKELATAANQSMDEKEHRVPQLSHRGSTAAQILSQDDLNSGGVATVLFLQGMDLFVANVGDAQAMLIHSEGGHRIITRKHDPAEPSERQRIRDAGGYVSRHGKLNDVLDVSRAFGYIQMMPAVMAAPHVTQIALKEQDEMILIASKELWDYMTPDVVVDVARSERGDLMRAAQKLRDLAIAFGATGKIMVMMIGVSDLKKRERNRYRGQSLSMGPSGAADDQFFSSKRGKRPRDGPDDSMLSRLDQEVEAPTGDVSIIFTDIKNSTLLWETYPVAMQSAIKSHNALMRRQLRIIGGYEVKTEGDAFMVSFPTATSALLWCFSVQSHLLDVQWPSEILSSVHGAEILDADSNRIFRGLSVRMGIHWGTPVCEPDPVTRRMDYFGPMVNRASRISSVADGGQITVSSDFITEIHRTLEAYSDSDRTGSTGSEDTLNDDLMGQAIRRELRSLSTQGFEVKDLGERKLKGLENPEYVYLMYPHSLAGRLIAQQQRADAEAAAAGNDPASMSKNSQLSIDTQNVWDLWNVSLRLEMLCSALECPGSTGLKAPETAILERMKNRGGEVTDRFLVHFVEHQVTRIETCISTLAMRHMIHPFRPGTNLLKQACPMEDIFETLTAQLEELQAFRSQQAGFVMEDA
ncbi:MAG: cysteinyl-tRNA synthetase [Candelina mexicana]|nr:MAG: cysteinyl-tRNA synthetase [Candelina mexicana]